MHWIVSVTCILLSLAMALARKKILRTWEASFQRGESGSFTIWQRVIQGASMILFTIIFAIWFYTQFFF